MVVFSLRLSLIAFLRCIVLRVISMCNWYPVTRNSTIRGSGLQVRVESATNMHGAFKAMEPRTPQSRGT